MLGPCLGDGITVFGFGFDMYCIHFLIAQAIDQVWFVRLLIGTHVGKWSIKRIQLNKLSKCKHRNQMALTMSQI